MESDPSAQALQYRHLSEVCCESNEEDIRSGRGAERFVGGLLAAPQAVLDVPALLTRSARSPRPRWRRKPRSSPFSFAVVADASGKNEL
jgi:hypothetical protein